MFKPTKSQVEEMAKFGVDYTSRCHMGAQQVLFRDIASGKVYVIGEGGDTDQAFDDGMSKVLTTPKPKTPAQVAVEKTTGDEKDNKIAELERRLAKAEGRETATLASDASDEPPELPAEPEQVSFQQPETTQVRSTRRRSPPPSSI